MTKHTKGPWHLDKYGNLITDSIKTGLNMVPFNGLMLNGTDEAKANTQLISAAPELLEALEQCIAAMAWREFGECRIIADKPILTTNDAIDMARAAIAKAKGEL